MKIPITGQQYRELSHMMALSAITDAINNYWMREIQELKNKKVKLSKPTAAMIQKFVLSLSNSMLEQKQKYTEMITVLAKDNKYELDKTTIARLSDDELAVILIQQTAETKENENGLE